MPGIAGIFSADSDPAYSGWVDAMVRSMVHEPFYTSGTQSFPELGIHAGWVAHRGAFADNQVFWNTDRSLALLFCGECFPAPELRAELRARGQRVGGSPADWLVPLYEESGDRFFEKPNGMFSGLLVDKRQQRAFLFNDRYGMERLYWHESPDAFYFASEAKALLQVLPQLRRFDAQGVADFLACGATLDGRTLFQGVGLLPGASLCTWESGALRKRIYFTREQWESQSPLPRDLYEEQFGAVFKRVLPRYFQTSQALGISLTAGLDTRMIMACRPETDPKPVCYTFAGESPRLLDATLAARIAQTCGYQHHVLRVEHDFLKDYASLVDRTVYLTDGTFGSLGAHEIYLNRKARQLAPVRLTGNFGSEIFRGVSTFKPLGLAPALFSPETKAAVALAVPHRDERGHSVSAAAFREVPLGLFGSLAAGRSQVCFRTPYLDNELVALAFRAPRTVLESADAALRLIARNSAALSAIPTDRGYVGERRGLRVLSRRLYAEFSFKCDYYYNEGLPGRFSRLGPLFSGVASALGTIGLHKFLSYSRWFRQELKPYIIAVLSDPATRKSSFWDAVSLQQMASAHFHSRRNYLQELNAVITLAAVDRLLLRTNSSSPTLAPSCAVTASSARLARSLRAETSAPVAVKVRRASA